MNQARRFDSWAWGVGAPMEQAQLRAKLDDLHAQTFSVVLTDSFGDELPEQKLRFIEGSRKLGKPAGAASRARCEF